MCVAASSSTLLPCSNLSSVTFSAETIKKSANWNLFFCVCYSYVSLIYVKRCFLVTDGIVFCLDSLDKIIYMSESKS